jgi:hypothetical protein
MTAMETTEENTYLECWLQFKYQHLFNKYGCIENDIQMVANLINK